MSAATYIIKLVERLEIAEDTMAFIFEKPQNFIYQAGQYGIFTLINPPETDSAGNSRCFSLANPPQANELMIATRMRNSAFKQVLRKMPIGSELKLKGPAGQFILHNNPEIPAVYLSGGIGITPVKSIIHQATEDKLPHQIYLFYSNHRPEDAIFLTELMALTKKNPNYHFIGTMTDMDTSIYDWNGERDLINQEMLAKYIPNLTTPIYYISGPAAMVTSMRSMLNEAGIANVNIHTEEFSGY